MSHSQFTCDGNEEIQSRVAQNARRISSLGRELRKQVIEQVSVQCHLAGHHYPTGTNRTNCMAKYEKDALFHVAEFCQQRHTFFNGKCCKFDSSDHGTLDSWESAEGISHNSEHLLIHQTPGGDSQAL
jgi:hypothetical protein